MKQFKEKLILDFLKKNKRAATTKIASAIKADLWLTMKYLEALETIGTVERQSETNATYWVLGKRK